MKNLLPKQAHDLVRDDPNAVFIDCRSDAEYFLVGHSLVYRQDGTVIRPELIMWADELRMELNDRFVQDVQSVAKNNHQPVVVICRSGRRSVLAGEALEAAGFTDVYNVLHGFEGTLDDQDHRGTLNGWRFNGLPWEQL
jgi:rhodanese-related sulfurtransferase